MNTLKTYIVKNLLIALLFLSSLTTLRAQQGWELGGWIGGSHYFGDLNTSFNLSRPGVALGLIGRYNFNTRLCVKMNVNYGRVSAYDSDSDNTFEQMRNLSFRSDLFEGAVNFEFNFLPYVHGSREEFYTPYLFAGFSIVNFNPKADLNGQTYNLKNFGTEGQFDGEEYFGIAGAFNYGIGFKIDLSYEWSINVELGARRLYTDYLDDVSTTYPDMEDLEAQRGSIAVQLSDRSFELDNVDRPIGELGRQRGNSKNNDSFAMLGIGLVYYFGDIRCPKYSR